MKSVPSPSETSLKKTASTSSKVVEKTQSKVPATKKQKTTEGMMHHPLLFQGFVMLVVNSCGTLYAKENL